MRLRGRRVDGGRYFYGEGLDLVVHMVEHMVELRVVCEEERGGEAEYERRVEARLAFDFRRFVVERAEMVDYDVEIAFGDVFPFVLRVVNKGKEEKRVDVR